VPQAITPYLGYEDTRAAIEFLTRAFGFREVVRYEDESGTVTHAELELGAGSIMLGWPGPEFRSPRSAGGHTVLIHAYVDDVDAHHARASAEGATIVREPRDEVYGDRRYDCEDPEGHRWSFAEHLEERAPEDWGASRAE